ncbi:hypothetical protein [Streptomyces halobius]|uniref:Uncharacterized protein n=1 Tax=Streptomyces halobius TaxID=2879846 RepID=A0ABY4MEE3_9ACTN|nr:hypothetical protein [Streptomyces halobius]UQA95687.1 hypothetical protein K9S39_30905 [Streptomyces halobius]
MSACTCPYCRKPAALEPEAQPVPEPVELPSAPWAFRVHSPDRAPQGCTLHPDGTITSVMGGQLWRCGQSFDEMRAMGWGDSHIEWDPGPLDETEQ